MMLRFVLAASLSTTLMLSAVHADDTSTPNAHSFSFKTAEGQLNFSDFAGKAVLVVNTASQCSFTKQYGPLQTLYEKYEDKGLVILAVPSNDFGGQEPGTDKEIIDFATSEFAVDFPITSKSTVKGSDADPFYLWAADEVGRVGVPRWNFHKYLIGPDGEMVNWFSTFTEPNSAKLARAIEAVLPERGDVSENIFGG